MAESATLNVRMDARTKDAFVAFCDAIGMSASSLMNVFAKTVVRNQAVPFTLTTVPEPGAIAAYGQLFPQSTAELDEMLEAAEATPLSECTPMEAGFDRVREQMGW